jgi:protein tyrosine phosphatase (PTP) superfamily phosphohydrolase (DUF442 family)
MIRKPSHLALLLLFACSQENAAPTGADPAAASGADMETAATVDFHLPVPIESQLINHFLDLGHGLYSGAMPSGPEAFAELAALGIKTVVNVDSARPAVEWAKEAGMEYVHIPIGYDGIPEEAAYAFERVIRDSARPIYFHCHHGKHRGPAAAAIALRAASGCSAEQAKEVLVAAGTSEDYKGLWRDVAAWSPPGTDILLPELVSVAKIADFPAGMAKIDRVWDRLKLVRKAGWKTPADHPDLVANQEALILAQLLHDSSSLLPAELLEDREFERRIEEAAELADALLLATRGADAEVLEGHYRDLATSCKNCHRDYRNE